MRKFLFAVAAAAVASAGYAADQPRPVVAPIVPCQPVILPSGPCPPGTIYPGMPGTPPSTPPGIPPVTPPVTNTPDVSSAFARQSEGGTQAASSFAPNMFGDILGARSIRFTYRANALAQFGVSGGTTLGDGTPGIIVSPTPSGTIQFSDSTGQRGTVALNQVAGGQNLNYAQPLLAGGGIDTAYAKQAVELLLSRGQLTDAQLAQFNRLTPQQRQQILANRGAINASITQSLYGITIPRVRVDSIAAAQNSAGILYDLALTADSQVPVPGGSTLVGRIKMSEDTSPIPRDRFIFAYDNFDSVPLTTFGTTVNRFQFGVEKTFLDGRWSFEFRLPFAGTVASTSVQGFEVNHTELGNVRLALKRIATQNQLLTTSSGIAVTLPTAQDQVALSALDGSELFRFRNEQVTVEPFVAAVLTPNSRLFSQTWASVNFDVSGGDLTWNRQVFGGSGSQRIFDLPILSVDQQVGYWLIQNDVGTLRGLAPFVELHWNYLIAQQEVINQVGDRTNTNALAVSGVANNELNLVTGLLMQVGDNLNLSVGASAPLLRKPDRTFDYQIGVRANYLFGRTARARNPIYSINSY